MFRSKKVHPLLLMLAVSTLSILALVLSYVGIVDRQDLLQQGRLTSGVVVGVDVGVRGLKRVKVAFIAADGRRVIGLDIHSTQWFAANDVGDEVMLYYDPDYHDPGPPDILVDRGLWIWSIPLFLAVAGVGLLVLGLYLLQQNSKKK